MGIDHPDTKSREDIAPQCISNTENWITWDGDLENPNVSEDNWEVDDESDLELDHNIEFEERKEQWDVSATWNVPWLIQSICRW